MTQLSWDSYVDMFPVICRVGQVDKDARDEGPMVDLMTSPGTVYIETTAPEGLLSYLEADGHHRLVRHQPHTYNIDPNTGSLVTEDGGVLYLLDPNSDRLTPKGYHYKATITWAGITRSVLFNNTPNHTDGSVDLAKLYVIGATPTGDQTTLIQLVSALDARIDAMDSTDHNTLSNRDAEDQHPIGAITGLRDELGNKVDKGALPDISHKTLTDKDALDQHPIVSIIGLQQALDEKADLNGIPQQKHTDLLDRDAINQHPIAAITGLQTALNSKANSGEVGVTVHDDLTGRDAADQHPIAAITGLSAALNDKADNADVGVKVHTDLSGRDAVDQHPIAAITGLQNALDGKLASVPDASPTAKGVVRLTNHLSGTADAPTVRSATTAVTGVVELATNTEVASGIDTARVVTPAGLKSVLATYVSSPTVTTIWTGTLAEYNAIGTKVATTLYFIKE